MKVESTIDSVHNLIYRKCTGDVKIEDIITEIHKSIQDKKFKSNMNAIWDFRMADLKISKTALRNELYPKLKNLEQKRGDKYKVGILISKDDDFVLAIIHEALAPLYNMPFISRVFKYKDELIDWFKIEPDHIDYL